MKKLIVVCGMVLAASSTLFAQGPKNISERLDGFQEDPLALSTSGQGQFHARISNDGTSIAYELSYSNLEGTITQAHIHVGRPAQSGGIAVFLCSNLGNGPAGTQLCPAAPATIEGVIAAVDVIGPGGQGITAGQFGELLRAIRTGTTYINVHTTLYPGGEIRANVSGPGGQGHGHDKH